MKVFGTLCGLLFLGMFGLFFWWLFWKDDAKALTQEVSGQITVLERFWNREAANLNGKLVIRYEDIAPSGFPFGMRARLLRPYVQDVSGDTKITLIASYLDVIPRGNDGMRFEIEYPKDGHLIVERAGQSQSYYLVLSETPPLFVQKVEVGGRLPSAVNEYGLQLPSQLILTADSEAGATKRFPMQLISTQEPMYRPLFRNLRARVASFTQLIQRGGI